VSRDGDAPTRPDGTGGETASNVRLPPGMRIADGDEEREAEVVERRVCVWDGTWLLACEGGLGPAAEPKEDAWGLPSTDLPTDVAVDSPSSEIPARSYSTFEPVWRPFRRLAIAPAPAPADAWCAPPVPGGGGGADRTGWLEGCTGGGRDGRDNVGDGGRLPVPTLALLGATLGDEPGAAGAPLLGVGGRSGRVVVCDCSGV